MSEDFKPGTRPLLRLAGLDAVRQFVSRPEEGNELWAAVLALLMRIHLHPDPEARRAVGPSDSQVISGLRVALAENFGTEAADYISWALILYGCTQKPTQASLHPWEKLMFEWKERRANAPRIALMLRDAGLERPLKAAALEALDGWITNPVTALGAASTIISTLFGSDLISYNLHDDGSTPAHDALLRTLVAAALPTTTLVLPRQRLVAGAAGARWRIEYTLDDLDYSFEAVANGSVLDAGAVMTGVDDLLARLGRPERIFRLMPGRAGNGEIGLFVAIEAKKFSEIAWRLRLPLLRSPAAFDLSEAVMLPEAARAAVQAGASRRAQTGPGAGQDGRAPAQRGDTLSVLESRFASVLPPERDADSSMRALLTSLRRSFGAGRLLQGGRWMRQSRAEPPAWLASSGDPAAILYEKQEVLFRKDRITWGALVEADEAVYSSGTDDRPGVLVYGVDDYFDARPAELSAIATWLGNHKSANTANTSELHRFAQLVRNDSGRPLNVPVPVTLSGHEAMLTSFVAVRAHLPDGILGADWFPVLTHPSSVIPLIVPFTYWPPALLAAWRERRLFADPERVPEAEA